MSGCDIAVHEDYRLQLRYLARQVCGLWDTLDHVFARTDLSVPAGCPIIRFQQTFEKLWIAAIFCGQPILFDAANGVFVFFLI